MTALSTPPPGFQAIARSAAARYGLDPALVCGVIDRESSWDQYATRYEQEFFNRYIFPLFKDPTISATEAHLRAFSWGLMQVMGQTAREFGYAGALPALCLPLNGVEVGCKVLAHKIAVNGNDAAKGLEAWNGGANPNYAPEVLALTAKYKIAS
ncbi:MAG: transglycosylase SLT domain-containing protein [Candidatus Acidiferrales bacterium]